jgi:hypothetical protein
MNGNEDLVTITMNSYGVIEVLVLIIRSELDIYVLGYTRRYHTFLIVFNLEIGRAWR